jgi:hypothetical protein
MFWPLFLAGLPQGAALTALTPPLARMQILSSNRTRRVRSNFKEALNDRA